MRKSAKCVLATLLMFCFAGNVKAAECSYDKQVELNNQAATVKAIYEEVDIDTGEQYYDDMNFDENGNYTMITRKVKGFNIKLLNLTQNLSAEVSNDSGFKRNISYDNTENGLINIATVEANKINNYSIKILVENGPCAGRELRVINLLVPMYNTYSETSYCKNNPNFEYCKEYTTDNIQLDYIQFDEATKKYEETKKQVEEKKEKQTKIEKILEILKDNSMIIIIGVGMIIIVTAGVIIVRRRRRLI